MPPPDGLESVVLDPLDDAMPTDQHVAVLAGLTLLALERPGRIRRPTVARCERELARSGLATHMREGMLGFFAALAYSRPELIGEGVVAGLEALLTSRDLPSRTYRAAAELLRALLLTPAASDAVELELRLLAQRDRPAELHETLLQSLRDVAFWAVAQLDLEALVSLAESRHLARARTRLLHEVIERGMWANPVAVTPVLLSRLMRLYGAQRSFGYCLYFLAHRQDPSSDVSRWVSEALEQRSFRLHASVRQRLGTGPTRLLIVQNIADGQGDEIVRVVPLAEALLAFNPRLEIVLITGRAYLYAQSRLRPVPIEPDQIRAALREQFDGVIDFFESNVRSVNYSLELEGEIQRYLAVHTPFLRVSAGKGWNRFVYERVDVDDRAWAEPLGLQRQRVENVYETTFRLIAELGLPLRLGRQPPASDSVLAGLPCADAEADWAVLIQRNVERRPVALVSPFGGAEPLKGYVERTSHRLADLLCRLVADGFYVILLPNGRPWGTAALARRITRRLAPADQAQLVVAGDPTDGNGEVTYFVRFADLVVSVEGWMVHAAYCLGKPYRVLMLPYSHPAEWHPYGRTWDQDIVWSPSGARVSEGEGDDVPPLPDQPWKFALLFALRQVGMSGDIRALPLLRQALRSEDHDVRRSAAEALSLLPEAALATELLPLLNDSSSGVRAAVARGLLTRLSTSPAPPFGVERDVLLAHHFIDQPTRNWAEVIRLGNAARPALAVAVRDDDPVVCREASWAQQTLDRLTERRRPSGLLRRLQDLGPRRARPARPSAGARVLILTPLKDAADCLDGYCARLFRLTYPHALISLGFLESDSRDTTVVDLRRRLPRLRQEFRRVGLWKRDFGFLLPPGIHRGAPSIQVARRAVLARSRNHLLVHALDDEDWVLWLDVDVIEYPADIIERLRATGKDIVQPHCVLEHGGPTFDTNGWRSQGQLHLDDLRGEGELVELDAVGGTVLLVRADIHRDGLVFPSFLYGRENPRIRKDRGELETEGLGIMARDMGHVCWGMPHLEVIHRRA